MSEAMADENIATSGYPPSIDHSEMDRLKVQYYVRIFWEHRWWILGFTGALTLLGALWVFLAIPLYSATTTIFLDVGSPAKSVSLSRSYSDDWWAMSELYLSAQLELIGSKEVAEEAFKALNLESHPAFRGNKDPVSSFRGMIKVQRKRDSALFNISVVCPYQKDVAAWTDAVAEAYKKVTIRNKLKVLEEANVLMKQQITSMEGEYERLGKRYGAYLTETGSYFPANQKAITDSRIQQIELRRNEIVMQRSSVEAKLSQLRTIKNQNQDPLALVSVKDDLAIQSLVQQYQQAEKDLSQLQTQMTSAHPKVVKKRDEIETIRQRIRDQALLVLGSMESQYAALNKEYADLTGELGNLKLQAAQLTGGSSQGEAMQSGVDAIRNYMNLLSQKIQELDVAASLTSNSIAVVERAQTPGAPSYPEKLRTIGIAFLLGLLGSTGSLIALQYFDTRIKYVDDIEKRFGLTLVTTIPKYDPKHRGLIVEAFQSLRTSLLYLSDQKAKNVLMVTSPSANEGKSTVVCNLGITLAASGDRVLLLDCDARQSVLAKYFKLDEKRGLVDYLAAEDDDPSPFIMATDKPNLWLLAAGKSPVNPPTLFTMDKFKRLVQHLRKQYMWVIIDTPPTLAVTDASIVASHVDLCFLVIKFRGTRHPLIGKAMAQLERIGQPVSGAILNEFEWVKDYYYTNYYYKHYGYYHSTAPPETPWDLVANYAARLTHRKSTDQAGVKL